MKDLYGSIKHIASSINDEAIIFFSTGKDSAVMLDLIQRFFKLPGHEYIYLYFHKGLSIRESVLSHYSKRYKIKFQQYPQFDVANQAGVKKKLRQADIEKFVRLKQNKIWMFYGYRKTESLERRGMMAHIDNGIDWKYKKLYPIADWSAKDVLYYIKQNKLVLPPDYRSGFRDINVFKGRALLWLYNNYRSDYELIKSQYPGIEGELLRASK